MYVLSVVGVRVVHSNLLVNYLRTFWKLFRWLIIHSILVVFIAKNEWTRPSWLLVRLRLFCVRNSTLFNINLELTALIYQLWNILLVLLLFVKYLLSQHYGFRRKVEVHCLPFNYQRLRNFIVIFGTHFRNWSFVRARAYGWFLRTIVWATRFRPFCKVIIDVLVQDIIIITYINLGHQLFPVGRNDLGWFVVRAIVDIMVLVLFKWHLV